VSPPVRALPLRQLALFVLAVVVPCLLIVGLGIRIIVEEEELADKHADDERRLMLAELERSIVARLDQLKHLADQPLTPGTRLPSDEIALAAVVQGERLILPFDDRSAGASLRDPAFASAIDAAEREEFATGRLDRAEVLLHVAAQTATTREQSLAATLLLARVLGKRGRPAAAEDTYVTLLHAPVHLVDDAGIPFALYAVQRLAATADLPPDRRREVNAVVDAVLDAATLPVEALYMLREADAVLGRAAAQGPTTSTRHDAIERRITDGEHALVLQRDFSRMAATWQTSPDAWVAHGAPLWLLGSAIRGGDRVLVAVRAEPLMASIGRAALRLTADTSGEPLGARLQGVRAVWLPAPSTATTTIGIERAFYGALLAIVVSVTLFGGYLLWRDVRRETRVAALRAQFVSSVSHELRTPLTAIRMFAETLRLGRVGEDTRAEYLDTIVNESERLSRLLTNVLDFSKIEQHRKMYARDRVDLAEVIRAAARTMAYPLAQHGFILHVEVEPHVPPLDGDRDAIEQAILNLLTNAMKYSGDGRDIELRLTRDRAHAVIVVQDHGIGIATHEHERIFEKFYRVQTPDHQRIPGAGLGLTLVDHIVRAHDGSIDVDSALGRGSTFSIRLPLGAEGAQPIPVGATS
jgi:signal transduction histidine kinase